MQRMLGDVLSLLKRGTIGSTNSNLINRDVSSNSDVVELLDGSTSPHSSTLANKVRGSIASALWALARTPALVDAIEHEETKHGEEKQLSYILRKLGGDEVVQDSTMAKESIEEAEAYLAATSMPVNGYMEPMEAVRAIVGPSGNAQAVLETATKSVYSKNAKCRECQYTDAPIDPDHVEMQLNCLQDSAQLMVERRAHSGTKRRCPRCNRREFKEEWKMKVAPDCLVATWKVLGARGSDKTLKIRREGAGAFDVFSFKLAVMVVITKEKKNVCLFRHGNDYYMAKDQRVKEIGVSDWLNAKPVLALYDRDPLHDVPSTSPHERSASSATSCDRSEPQRATAAARGGEEATISSLRARVGKRPRTEYGSGTIAKSPRRKSPSFILESDLRRAHEARAVLAMPLAQEVIEVNDDEEDVHDGGGGRSSGGDRGQGGYSTNEATQADGEGTRASGGGRGSGGTDPARLPKGDGDGRFSELKIPVATMGVPPSVAASAAGDRLSLRQMKTDEMKRESNGGEMARIRNAVGKLGQADGGPKHVLVNHMEVDESDGDTPTEVATNQAADGPSCGVDTISRRITQSKHPASAEWIARRRLAGKDTSRNGRSSTHSSSSGEIRFGSGDAAAAATEDEGAGGMDKKRSPRKQFHSNLEDVRFRDARPCGRRAEEQEVMSIGDTGSDTDDEMHLIANGTATAASVCSGRMSGCGTDSTSSFLSPSSPSKASTEADQREMRREGGGMSSDASGLTEKNENQRVDRIAPPGHPSTNMSGRGVSEVAYQPAKIAQAIAAGAAVSGNAPAQAGGDGRTNASEGVGTGDSATATGFAGAGSKSSNTLSSRLHLQRCRPRVSTDNDEYHDSKGWVRLKDAQPEVHDVVDDGVTTPVSSSTMPPSFRCASKRSPTIGALWQEIDDMQKSSAPQQTTDERAAELFVLQEQATRRRKRVAQQQAQATQEPIDVQLKAKCTSGSRSDGWDTGRTSRATGGAVSGRLEWRGPGEGGDIERIVPAGGRRRQNTLPLSWGDGTNSNSSFGSRAAAAGGTSVTKRKPPMPIPCKDTPGGDEDENVEWNEKWEPNTSSGAAGHTFHAEAEVRRPMTRAISGSSGGGREKQAMEDLTGPDTGQEGEADVDWSACRKGNWLTSRPTRKQSSGGWGAGAGGGGSNLSVNVRGITLRQDHFDRIHLSDGWLTSQIVDIRVKQLQEKYPENLYFDSSFFGFLCPATEKGGSFVVDYSRVKGWTKSSRLPSGKSSLFDMNKLFIPINQGNVHWILVVVDLDGSGSKCGSEGNDGGVEDSGETAKRERGTVISFFDSFGRDGSAYVEAVQEYLISELSSREKTREELFVTRSRPPNNAPRQHNTSDCGVLMLYVMEVTKNKGNLGR